ncbi:MAG TPA: preprotein translocase subunit SecE [Chitinispirillaceae bacterium]|nr:preprotein translocase subunit SecE [Chitinispirillaceae bacterium]
MQKFVQYLKDVRSELAKVNWPTRDEVTGATLLVVVSSLAVSLFVYGVDRLLVTIVNFFLKSGV